MLIRIVVSEGDEVLSSASINHMIACLLLKSNSVKICMIKACLSKLGKEQYENNNNTKSNRFTTIERLFKLFETALVALDSLLVSNNKSMLEFNMQSNHFFFNYEFIFQNISSVSELLHLLHGNISNYCLSQSIINSFEMACAQDQYSNCSLKLPNDYLIAKEILLAANKRKYDIDFLMLNEFDNNNLKSPYQLKRSLFLSINKNALAFATNKLMNYRRNEMILTSSFNQLNLDADRVRNVSYENLELVLVLAVLLELVFFRIILTTLICTYISEINEGKGRIEISYLSNQELKVSISNTVSFLLRLYFRLRLSTHRFEFPNISNDILARGRIILHSVLNYYSISNIAKRTFTRECWVKCFLPFSIYNVFA
jgi:hypothetical protein